MATVGGALLADDNGAGAANASAADSTRLQTQIAQDQWERYKQIYAPLEQNYVDEAQNYDSAENYARAAGDASATVSSQFGKARDRLSRTPGLDPSTPGAQASMVGLDLAQAASDATQQNAARQKVKDVAYARKTDALSLGKGLPAQASSALATASQQSLNQAKYGTALGMDQAAAIGGITNRVTSAWLGNASAPTFTSKQIADANAWNVPQGPQELTLGP